MMGGNTFATIFFAASLIILSGIRDSQGFLHAAKILGENSQIKYDELLKSSLGI
jgi:hypothetical protein